MSTNVKHLHSMLHKSLLLKANLPLKSSHRFFFFFHPKVSECMGSDSACHLTNMREMWQVLLGVWLFLEITVVVFTSGT